MINIKINIEKEYKTKTINFPVGGESFLNFIKRLEKNNINIPKKYKLYCDNSVLKENDFLQFSNNESITLRDISNQEKLIKFGDLNAQMIKIEAADKNDKTIPKELSLCPGINLIGDCDNKRCDGKSVISNIKEDIYNFIENNGIMICPLCECRQIVKNIIFFNCYYNYYGKKLEGDKEVKITSFGKKIENFKNAEIIDDKYVKIDGEDYEIKKTDIGCFNTFEPSKSDINYIELVFQIRKFKF